MAKMTREGTWQLRVDLTDWDGRRYFALYDRFRVGPGPDYRLSVSGFNSTSTLGDSLGHGTDGEADGMRFSTSDHGSDNSGNNYCTERYRAGWWYNNCFNANLNNVNYGSQSHSWEGIVWQRGGTRGDSVDTFREATMKIRKSD